MKISYTKKSQKSLFQVDNLILSRNVIYTNIVVINVLKHFKIPKGWVVQVKSSSFLAQDKKSRRSYPDGWRHLLFKKITKIAEFYRALLKLLLLPNLDQEKAYISSAQRYLYMRYLLFFAKKPNPSISLTHAVINQKTLDAYRCENADCNS